MNDRVALHRVVDELGDDEIRVLAFIARRLKGGASVYGMLDLATDQRNWHREAAEEDADGAVYKACAALAESMRKAAR
jgi:hypothetical protein